MPAGGVLLVVFRLGTDVDCHQPGGESLVVNGDYPHLAEIDIPRVADYRPSDPHPAGRICNAHIALEAETHGKELDKAADIVVLALRYSRTFDIHN